MRIQATTAWQRRVERQAYVPALSSKMGEKNERKSPSSKRAACATNRRHEDRNSTTTNRRRIGYLRDLIWQETTDSEQRFLGSKFGREP